MIKGKTLDTWVPNRSQALFYNSKSPTKLFKGGMRSGKSVAGYCDTWKDALLYPGIKILYTRTTLPELNIHFQEFQDWKPEGLQVHIEKTPEYRIVLPNGSTITFKAFENHDVPRVRSREFGQIVMEEGNLFTKESYDLFLTRITQTTGRSYDRMGQPILTKIPNEAHRLRIITNSGGRDWVWREFDRDHPDAYAGTNPDFFAVRCKSEENRSHLSEDWFRRMEFMDELSRKRLMDVDDSPWEGLIFYMFDRKIHILDQDHFIPPPHWPVYVGIDYGNRTDTHAVWVTVTESGHYIAFYEFYTNGMTVRSITEAIKAITTSLINKGMAFPTFVIDPSTAQEKEKDKLSVYQQFIQCGLNGLIKGKRETNDLAGVAMMRQMMEPHPAIDHPISSVKVSEKGWPMLYFSSGRDCKKVISQVEEWSWQPTKESSDKDKPEKPQEKNDHGCDALRYAISRAVQVAPEDPLTVHLRKHSFKAKMNELAERQFKERRAEMGGWQGRLKPVSDVH